MKIESYSPERHDLSQIKGSFDKARSLCVALRDDRVVGCINFDATTGEIFHVTVDPAYRGRHIARHLIEHITGCVLSPMLKAYVTSSCVPFFEACGFMCESDGTGKFACYRVNKGKRCC